MLGGDQRREVESGRRVMVEGRPGRCDSAGDREVRRRRCRTVGFVSDALRSPPSAAAWMRRGRWKPWVNIIPASTR